MFHRQRFLRHYKQKSECCQKFNLSLEIETIHLDLQERIHPVVREMFPDEVIKSCRFHLRQAW
jgi:hypothetical protein